MAVNTPLHTIEILRKHNTRADSLNTGARFLDGLDTRVLAWLLDDAERLNRLEARAIEAGFEDLEHLVAQVEGTPH